MKKSVGDLKANASKLFGEQKEGWAALTKGAIGALDTLSKENVEVGD